MTSLNLGFLRLGLFASRAGQTQVQVAQVSPMDLKNELVLLAASCLYLSPEHIMSHRSLGKHVDSLYSSLVGRKQQDAPLMESLKKLRSFVPKYSSPIIIGQKLYQIKSGKGWELLPSESTLEFQTSILYVKPALLDVAKSHFSSGKFGTEPEVEDIQVQNVSLSQPEQLAQLVYYSLKNSTLHRCELTVLNNRVSKLQKAIKGPGFVPVKRRKFLRFIQDGYIIFDENKKPWLIDSEQDGTIIVLRDQMDQSKAAFNFDPKHFQDVSAQIFDEYDIAVSYVASSLLATSYSATSSNIGSTIKELHKIWVNLEENESLVSAPPPRACTVASEPSCCTVKAGESIFLFSSTVMKEKGSERLFLLVPREGAELVGNEELPSITIPPVLLDSIDLYKESFQFEESDGELEELLSDNSAKVNGDFSSKSKDVSNQLEDYYKTRIQPHELSEDRGAFAKKLERILSNNGYPGCEVNLFGSSVNNLGMEKADADASISLPQDSSSKKKDLGLNMYKLQRMFQRAGMKNVVPVASARVPICKFYDPEFKLHCDVNIGHALGVHNSRMLCAYTELDPRVKPLVMLVKWWAKKRDLNDPSGRGTLSSYAYSLMAIAFLQHRKIIPSLQTVVDIPERTTINVKEVNLRRRKGSKGDDVMRMVDVSYLSNLSHPALAKYKRQDPSSIWDCEDDVASLFYGFMDYFSYTHSYKPDSFISIKDGGMVKKEPIDRFKLIVLDPFEVDRNCARMVTRALPLVVSEFRRARMLLQKGCVREVFEFIKRDD